MSPSKPSLGVVDAHEGQGGMPRMPTLYVPHGGGPWPWVDGLREGHAPLQAYLEQLRQTLPAPPLAVLCVTAHWEAPQVTLSSSANPGMLYDYGGFPKHTYQVRWPAPGAPEVVRRIRALLRDHGIPHLEDTERGFDHGTFVPLSVAWPAADVPTVQMSLVNGLDPAQHLAIGRALIPLRDEGVLILGSGMSYHNMGAFRALMEGRDGPIAAAKAFDGWLAGLDANCEDQLLRWTEAPGAREAHPRAEHLLPLMVAAGAGAGDSISNPFADRLLGAPVRALRFG